MGNSVGANNPSRPRTKAAQFRQQPSSEAFYVDPCSAGTALRLFTAYYRFAANYRTYSGEILNSSAISAYTGSGQLAL